MIPRETTFKDALAQYKVAIDADIAAYASHVSTSTRAQYGTYAADVSDVFLDVLGRGGKRIRGALVMVGYEMCGGKDRSMILRAATAIEMLNAYILMIDDIQDRSILRRGKATAHEMLAAYHAKHHLRGDAAHAGVSLTLNAALAGAHAAQMLLSGLSVDAELRMKAVGIVNHAMLVTSHGQTQDFMNELLPAVTTADIEHVLEWKTAYYTFLNPLCLGMVLAGVDCEDTNAIREYALPTGKAFQITDDIIGVFGDDAATGKSAMDDIREGKRTVLTHYALEHAPESDRQFLLAQLGNTDLTPEAFERCKQIITQSGARDHATEAATVYIAQAVQALDAHQARWQAPQVTFLHQLAQSLLSRTT